MISSTLYKNGIMHFDIIGITYSWKLYDNDLNLMKPIDWSIWDMLLMNMVNSHNLYRSFERLLIHSTIYDRFYIPSCRKNRFMQFDIINEMEFITYLVTYLLWITCMLLLIGVSTVSRLN